MFEMEQTRRRYFWHSLKIFSTFDSPVRINWSPRAAACWPIALKEKKEEREMTWLLKVLPRNHYSGMEIRILPYRRRVRHRPDRRTVISLQPPLYTIEGTFFHIEKNAGWRKKVSALSTSSFGAHATMLISFRLEENHALRTGVGWLYLSTASEHLVRITATG